MTSALFDNELCLHLLHPKIINNYILNKYFKVFKGIG